MPLRERFKIYGNFDSMALVGDVDGDGHRDLAAAGGNYISVFSGVDGSLMHEKIFEDLWPASTVARYMDYNGDGHADILLGRPDWGGSRFSGGDGVVFVYSPVDEEILLSVPAPYTSGSQDFGDTVLSMGDVDGDTINDFISSSPGLVSGGYIQLVSGADGSEIYTLRYENAGEPGFYTPSSHFASHVSKISDQDLDGVPDLIVRRDSGVFSDGELGVYSGRTGSLLWNFFDPDYAIVHSNKGSFGNFSVAIGDVDADSIEDFAVANNTPLASGEEIWVSVFSGSDGSIASRLLVPEGESIRSVRLMGAVDSDGDGAKELILLSGSAFSEKTLRLVDPMTGMATDLRLPHGATGFGDVIFELDPEANGGIALGVRGHEDGNAFIMVYENDAIEVKPSLSGASAHALKAGTGIGGSALVEVSDPQGSASIRAVVFADGRPGTDGGYFTLDGERVTDGAVRVEPDELDRVAYVAGPDAGRNFIGVKAIDEDGNRSETLRIRLDVQAPAPDLRLSDAEIFGDGALPFFALLAQAAYHQGAGEPGEIEGESVGTRNLKDVAALQTARTAYDEAGAALDFLGPAEMPGLAPNSGLDGWSFGLRGGADDEGIYTNENAAALVARGESSLFVAFRGTNDLAEPSRFWDLASAFDHFHWGVRSDHFDLLKPLLRDIKSYVEAAESDGDAIDTIYLTGHSLGAAMVQPAYRWLNDRLDGVTVEGTTFASPGYGPTLPGLNNTQPNAAIFNLWNAGDIINLPASASRVWGSELSFNNLLSALREGQAPWGAAHSMSLYRAMVDFLFEEGANANVDLDIDGFEALLDAGLDRIAASVRVSQPPGSDYTFEIGAKNDYVLAGLEEMGLAAAKASVGVILEPYKGAATAYEAASGARDVLSLIGSAPRIAEAEDSAEAIGEVVTWENFEAALSLLALINPWAAAAKALISVGSEYFGEDLVVGGVGRDTLIGLGGSDTILGGDDDDNLNGGLGADYLDGGEASDILTGGPGKDKLYGRDGPDFLYGGGGRDTLSGGEGGDLLDGGGGNFNQLEGGPGDDLYFVADENDFVIENPDSGQDTVIASIDYTLPPDVELLVLADRSFLGGLFSNLDGTGNGQANALTGNGEGNVLSGRGGNDVIFGEGGGDDLSGDAGNDTLLGGNGRDVLSGGGGADRLEGGPKNDDLTGGPGPDTFQYKTNSDIDRIMDFEDDVDEIVLDSSLWSGTLNKRQVIRDYAEEHRDGVEFDFDAGKLIVLGISTPEQLMNDLVLM